MDQNRDYPASRQGTAGQNYFNYTLESLLESGVHFGHKACRWNPQMAKYIYKVHRGVHIIDLPKTLLCLKRASDFVQATAKDGGRFLFVGTKVQAKDIIKQAAQRCGQHFVNHRWLGGTLTNWKTISESIKRLKALDKKVHSPEFQSYTKKEQLKFRHQLERLEISLGGIKDMGGMPDVLFVIDTNKEANAIKEANQLGIPVVAVVDTNSDPRHVTYPIPGNDDALKALQLYCTAMADAVLDGLRVEMAEKSGTEAGEKEGFSGQEENALAQEIMGQEKSEKSSKKEV